jgi:hypothetical protein
MCLPNHHLLQAADPLKHRSCRNHRWGRRPCCSSSVLLRHVLQARLHLQPQICLEVPRRMWLPCRSTHLRLAIRHVPPQAHSRSRSAQATELQLSLHVPPAIAHSLQHRRPSRRSDRLRRRSSHRAATQLVSSLHRQHPLRKSPQHSQQPRLQPRPPALAGLRAARRRASGDRRTRRPPDRKCSLCPICLVQARQTIRSPRAARPPAPPPWCSRSHRAASRPPPRPPALLRIHELRSDPCQSYHPATHSSARARSASLDPRCWTVRRSAQLHHLRTRPPRCSRKPFRRRRSGCHLRRRHPRSKASAAGLLGRQ